MNARASELGRAIHARRTQLGISLRELARRVEKAPSYIVALERSPRSPGATDETMRALALGLEMDADMLFGLANRSPSDFQPESALDVALHRAIKNLTEAQKRKLLREIDKTSRTDREV